MKKLNILDLLKRPDKWYLGGGNKLIWTPPFPSFLHKPGAWDKAHYYNIEIDPFFSWALLDDEGSVISAKHISNSWRPSELTSKFSADDLSITEMKTVLSEDVFVSNMTFKNNSGRKKILHIIAYSWQMNDPQKDNWITGADFKDNYCVFNKHATQRNRPEFSFGMALGLLNEPDSFSINYSQAAPLNPDFRFTPFYEKFYEGKLPNERKTKGAEETGFIYLGVHKKIIIRAKSELSVDIVFAAASTINEAVENIEKVKKRKDPIKRSVKNWTKYFADLPYFECDNEYITRYYWYRWYGLKLLSIYGNEKNYQYPAVCEGISYFRAPISYSAMCHMLETRWMKKPYIAEGSLLNFIFNQRDDGGFRGYIDVHFYRQEMFYHANWGNSVSEVFAIHKNYDFIAKAYEGLSKYVNYFDRVRDTEKSGLYDITNHYETGQEYMHRYVAVNPDADKEHWGEVFRLKGVDVTVYIYELKKVLAGIAEILEKNDESVKWKSGAGKIKRAVLSKMWDPKTEMFFDVDPATNKRTLVKAATCFYPYFTDIVSEKHLNGLKKNLLNKNEFWTEFPVPSSSLTDEFFNAEAEWKDERMNCPWNGRVWPMTNSHIAEALAASSINFADNELRGKTAEFITKFISMMFFEGDPNLPNCFEHYNPFNGKACLYRGVDDYQHSWVVDLIIKYVAGIRVGNSSIIIDPFPFKVKHFYIDNISLGGKNISVSRNKDVFKVFVNKEEILTSKIGMPVEVVID